ncbi:hypothetical protein ElyMa_003574600, partial [Elysia marginata]
MVEDNFTDTELGEQENEDADTSTVLDDDVLLGAVLAKQLVFKEVINQATQTNWQWVTMAIRWRHAKLIVPTWIPLVRRPTVMIRVDSEDACNLRHGFKSISSLENGTSTTKTTEESRETLPMLEDTLHTAKDMGLTHLARPREVYNERTQSAWEEDDARVKEKVSLTESEPLARISENSTDEGSPSPHTKTIKSATLKNL